MGIKWKIAISLSCIVILSWIELQFFSESVGVDETARKLAHIAFLIGVLASGYFTWIAHPVKWLRYVWLMGYGIAMFLIVGVGVIQWKTGFFASTFLDEIRDIRIFFSSPLPFIMLLAAPKKHPGETERQAAADTRRKDSH